jgi:hypothetical protein
MYNFRIDLNSRPEHVGRKCDYRFTDTIQEIGGYEGDGGVGGRLSVESYGQEEKNKEEKCAEEINTSQYDEGGGYW